jgi:hypothetical protein
MIGKIISHYRVLEKLPSTGLRTGPSTGLRTGGEGGNPAATGQALPTDRDRSPRTSLHQEISE